METEFLIVVVPILLHAIATCYSAFEAHQVRKSNLIQIEHAHQEKFEALLESAKDLHSIIEARELDLASIAKNDKPLYNKLVHWGEKYFWLCFNEWIQGHVWKSVPKYMSKNWDVGILDAMQKPFHRQVWEMEFKNKNFRGQKKFNQFINRCKISPTR